MAKNDILQDILLDTSTASTSSSRSGDDDGSTTAPGGRGSTSPEPPSAPAATLTLQQGQATPSPPRAHRSLKKFVTPSTDDSDETSGSVAAHTATDTDSPQSMSPSEARLRSTDPQHQEEKEKQQNNNHHRSSSSTAAEQQSTVSRVSEEHTQEILRLEDEELLEVLEKNLVQQEKRKKQEHEGEQRQQQRQQAVVHTHKKGTDGHDSDSDSSVDFEALVTRGESAKAAGPEGTGYRQSTGGTPPAESSPVRLPLHTSKQLSSVPVRQVLDFSATSSTRSERHPPHGQTDTMRSQRDTSIHAKLASQSAAPGTAELNRSKLNSSSSRSNAHDTMREKTGPPPSSLANAEKPQTATTVPKQEKKAVPMTFSSPTGTSRQSPRQPANSGERLYVQAQNTQRNKEKWVAQEKAEREAKLNSECTFAPQTSKRNRSNPPPPTQNLAVSTILRREHALAILAEEKPVPDECTFAPKVNGNSKAIVEQCRGDSVASSSCTPGEGDGMATAERLYADSARRKLVAMSSDQEFQERWAAEKVGPKRRWTEAECQNLTAKLQQWVLRRNVHLTRLREEYDEECFGGKDKRKVDAAKVVQRLYVPSADKPKTLEVDQCSFKPTISSLSVILAGQAKYNRLRRWFQYLSNGQMRVELRVEIASGKANKAAASASGGGGGGEAPPMNLLVVDGPSLPVLFRDVLLCSQAAERWVTKGSFELDEAEFMKACEEHESRHGAREWNSRPPKGDEGAKVPQFQPQLSEATLAMTADRAGPHHSPIHKKLYNIARRKHQQEEEARKREEEEEAQRVQAEEAKAAKKRAAARTRSGSASRSSLLRHVDPNACPPAGTTTHRQRSASKETTASSTQTTMKIRKAIPKPSTSSAEVQTPPPAVRRQQEMGTSTLTETGQENYQPTSITTPQAQESSHQKKKKSGSGCGTVGKGGVLESIEAFLAREQPTLLLAEAEPGQHMASGPDVDDDVSEEEQLQEDANNQQNQAQEQEEEEDPADVSVPAPVAVGPTAAEEFLTPINQKPPYRTTSGTKQKQTTAVASSGSVGSRESSTARSSTTSCSASRSQSSAGSGRAGRGVETGSDAGAQQQQKPLPISGVAANRGPTMSEISLALRGSSKRKGHRQAAAEHKNALRRLGMQMAARTLE